VALQQLIAEQAETIRDLRQRLDAAAEERRVRVSGISREWLFVRRRFSP